MADPAHDHDAVPDRAALVVLRRDRRRVCGARAGPRYPVGTYLYRDPPGAALPDRDPDHRPGDLRRAERLYGADPRYGCPGPSRGAAAGVSRLSGTWSLTRITYPVILPRQGEVAGVSQTEGEVRETAVPCPPPPSPSAPPPPGGGGSSRFRWPLRLPGAARVRWFS
ncbi:hypothetical protein SPHINGO391_400023 [Sphingomonas aurantiaca]|uniref:Uncharacterized protein n=1 Tax=Sphingomonas aurantiaca TaxID=185949 RepID=A0A5E7YV63_9SPHN|nr:hypothetical protein SPHINGO391_400023 [Sphingomonas aurantiaca]